MEKCKVCNKDIKGKSKSKLCYSCSAKNGHINPQNKHKNFCPDCGKELSYLSVKCTSCSKYKENNPNYKHGLTFNKKCKCGKLISYYNDRCRECWKKELSELYKGEGNPAWIEGKSFYPYPLGWNNTFKEQIRFRDAYQCRLCEKSEIENGKKLSVHHIDYNKTNLNINNLISLCKSCHSKTNTNRNYWEDYFKSIL